MKNEDEILRDFMSNQGDNYIRDDGFTGRVMATLPEKHRLTPGRRRVLLLAGAALVGCAATWMFSGPAILRLVTHFAGESDKLALGTTDPATIAIYLGGSLIVASIAGLICVKSTKI